MDQAADRDLSGTWQAAVADEELRRVYTEDGFDDAGWDDLTVPGHWRSTPAFAETDGPLLHRTRFEADHPPAGRRRWLCLDGIFYQGDVWLDGGYVGDTEGYFFPHAFEITDALAARREHLLAVEATCSPQHDRRSKRNITGVFQHWDCLDPDWNPGGIWRPVRLETTGPVRIRSLRVLCREANAERAVLALRATLDSDTARTVALRTVIGGLDHVENHPLAEGDNHVEWTVTCPDPSLWWPRALGDQPMHDVVVEVADATTGELSHGRMRRIGLRSVTMRDWVVSVNGERLFLKGANQGPSRMALADATPAELAGDVALAVDAGLDLLRIHAHITRRELYDAADDAGLLLWQDFPLQWGYARGIRRQAVRQVRRAIDTLGHHPSILLWCGHNEPLALDVEPGAELIQARTVVQFAMAQQLPTWNKTILDRSIRRAFATGDGSRPVVAHSGVLPHLPTLDGTDSHLYFGWYHGDERDFPGFCRAVPRLARFVSEFGAQAVPGEAGFMGPERWPDLDWERLGRTHALQKVLLDQRVPPADHASFDGWRAATQAYQATVIRHHVETLRRLKYRPTGGFAQFCFADGHPAVTWSVLGALDVAGDRLPKAGYQALRDACRPVIVVAERPPAAVAPGDTLALDVHVVSDLRAPLADVEVSAVLAWPGGEHRWRWQGDVGADDCVRVGTLQIVVPEPSGRGDLCLDLTLTAGGIDATNTYAAAISGATGR
ncbi:glycoside hydrolase family 2 TIM barrel-domain containing protein [soil metagenome]